MKYFLYIILYILFICRHGHFFKQEKFDYIKNKFEYAINELNPTLKTTQPKDIEINIDFFNATNKKLVNFDNPHIIYLSNKSYILLGSDIFPSTNLNKMEINKIYSLPDIEDSVALVIATMALENKNFILISFKNRISHIYTLNDIEGPLHIQSLKHQDELIDAKFFNNQNSLYLVIISTREVIIYQWLGEHFDQIHTIPTKFTKLASFSQANFEIIAFLDNTIIDESTISVYQFDGNLKKIQFFKIPGCYDIKIFPVQNKVYMMIFAEKDNFIYGWYPLNVEFIYHTEFQSGISAEEITTSSIENVNLIFIISKIGIQAYRMFTNNIQFLAHFKFEEHFKEVINVVEEQRQLQIFGKQADNEFNFLNVPYKLHRTEIVNSISYTDPLMSCLSILQDRLEKQLNSYKNKNAENVLPTSKNSNYNIYQNVKRSEMDTDLEPDFDPYEEALFRLRNTTQGILQEIVNITSKTNEILNDVINKTISIKGNLKSKRLTVNNVDVKSINDVEWVPEKWLSYTQDQTIKNQLDGKTLTSNNVEILNSTFLENVLFNSEDITIPKLVKVRNLQCNHLSTTSINGINFKDIYLKSSNNPVKGLKTFKTIKTENLISPHIDYPTNLQLDKFKFTPELEVKNLNVEMINDINWGELNKSLFQIGKTKKINGSLSMPNVIINKLEAKKINGIPTKDLLTKTTNQTVTSHINFNKVNVKNINVSKVNGIEFNKEIVLINSTNISIKGPVKIKKLQASTTNIEDTTNIPQVKHYKKLKIGGNLHIKNINLSPNAKMFLNGKVFNFESSKDYWLKNTDQIILKRVEILNVTAKNLETKTINGVDVENYMINGKNGKRETNYYFKHLSVAGNIKLNPDMEHFPNWSELDENIVRKYGGYKISGKKIFNGTIVLRDANIDYLNDIEVNSIPTVKSDLSDYKFNTMVVRGNLTLKKTSVDAINNIPINKFNDDFKFVDEELRFEKLYFENVSVNELEVEENFNGRNLSEYIIELNKIRGIQEVENGTNAGNLKTVKAFNVKSINGVPIELIEEAVREGAIMAGNITFNKDVVIENLVITHINDVNISHLMKRLLYKDWKQKISGYYTFNIVRANQLAASHINHYNIEGLIDVEKESPQSIKGNFKFTSVKFLGDLYGNLPCNLNEIVELFKNPPTKTLNSLMVTGNITTLSKDNNLQEIMDNVVRLDVDNIIDAPVNFFSAIHVNNVKSTNDINGVNLESIFDDALRKTEYDQLVTGHKIFNTMTCAGAQVDGNAQIPIVNTITIKKLNDSIITKDKMHTTTIRGHKIFTSGVKTNHLKTKSLSGLKMENIVNLDNLKPIPNVSFESLNIYGNLTINYINNVDFDKFLSNRFLRDYPEEQELSGIYYFDKVQLKAPSSITRINNMNLDDIVFDENEIITGSKHFNNLTIRGDVRIDVLNGVNITEEYHRSLFYNKKSELKGAMVLGNLTGVNSNITAESINGIPVKFIKELLSSDELNRKTKEIDKIVKQIGDVVYNHNVNVNTMSEEYMYLEKSEHLQVNIPNTISAEIIEGKDHILLHVTGEDPGEICGLPRNCNCQNQHVLQMSGEYSSQILGSKENERVFSFRSDKIVAHLVTYTVSYNRICSRNYSTHFPNESTSLTWIISNGPNNHPKTYVKYNLIDGFITGAKFFTYSEAVYVVVSRFYSPSLGTHNLDCVVFKFGHKQDSIELIQKIPTKGAWTLHLFNCHQGLILVIGNIYDSQLVISGTSTDIYIFREQSRQFELLRRVIGAGAISIADIVLDKETQIILAHRDSPLIIFKYEPVYNNFYMFQRLQLESEIISVSKFYIGGSKKDAYLNVVTENNNFYLYSYKHVEGWKLESQGEIEGLRALVPFRLNGNTHLLAPSTKLSSLLTVQKYG